jgi:hypothetical protein
VVRNAVRHHTGFSRHGWVVGTTSVSRLKGFSSLSSGAVPDLPGPSPSGQKQAGGVGTSDQQHHVDRSKQDQKFGSGRNRQALLQAHRDAPGAFGRSRPFVTKRLRQDVQLRLGLAVGDTAAKASEHLVVEPRAPEVEA